MAQAWSRYHLRLHRWLLQQPELLPDGATLLVAAVIPGIQRGHGTLKHLLSESKNTPAATATKTDDLTEGDPENNEDKQLGTALERELRSLQQTYRSGPVSWLLTETDAQGNVVESTEAELKARNLDSFTRSRGGRMLFEYKGVIFNTVRTWLTEGSTRVLGFLGLVLGMIMVPVYLFFFLKDSAAIRRHWHDYVPLRASRFKTDPFPRTALRSASDCSARRCCAC